MTLIPCPECDKEVSDRARACPNCGFPVAEEIGRALAEVTGFDNIRSVRQQLAANKLKTWSERYTEGEASSARGKLLESGSRFGGRHRLALVGGLAVIIVIVQLAILFSLVYR